MWLQVTLASPIMNVKIVGLISTSKTFIIVNKINMLTVENLKSTERYCVNSINI